MYCINLKGAINKKTNELLVNAVIHAADSLKSGRLDLKSQKTISIWGRPPLLKDGLLITTYVAFQLQFKPFCFLK